MALRAVLTAVLLLGIPLLVVAPASIYWQAQYELDRYSSSLVTYLGRSSSPHSTQRDQFIRAWVSTASPNEVKVEAHLLSGEHIVIGDDIEGAVMTSQAQSDNGATVVITAPMRPVIRDASLSVAAVLGLAGIAIGISRLIAEHEARRLSAPLIYLAAQAEQVGSGQVRPRIKRSGIEEIDLVQEELERTAQRMAGRLAAERQFASDASHQLRTPLTALSMRLEEIQMLSDDPQVQHEAEVSLEQVERLTGVVTDLLASSQRRGGGNTQAVSVSDIFRQQFNEWEGAFQSAGRNLELLDAEGVVLLTTPGNFSQALATLIENSLKYGKGTVCVEAKYIARKMATVTVSDEGEGIPEDIAAHVFEKGVSGFGSTGIGLALAWDLVRSDGGRLELSRPVPPVFTITLPALPAQMDPSKVVPEGSFVSMGRRRRGL